MFILPLGCQNTRLFKLHSQRGKVQSLQCCLANCLSSGPWQRRSAAATVWIAELSQGRKATVIGTRRALRTAVKLLYNRGCAVHQKGFESPSWHPMTCLIKCARCSDAVFVHVRALWRENRRIEQGRNCMGRMRCPVGVGKGRWSPGLAGLGKRNLPVPQKAG